MLSTILAIVFGIAALNAQPQDLPDKFVNGAINRGEPVVTEYFIGLEWKAKDGEINYAGLEYNFDDAAGLVTGP
jgi:hypothetical protein